MPPTDTATVRPTARLAGTVNASRLSYAELAAAVGCSKSLIGQIVADGAATSLYRAEALAAALGVPVAVLFRHKNGDPIGGE